MISVIVSLSTPIEQQLATARGEQLTAADMAQMDSDDVPILVRVAAERDSVILADRGEWLIGGRIPR